MRNRGRPTMRSSSVPAVAATPRLILRVTGIDASRVGIVAQAKVSAFTAYEIRKASADADLTPALAARTVASATIDFATPGVHVLATNAIDPTLLAVDAIATHTIDVISEDVLEVWVTQAIGGVAVVVATPTMS